MNLAKTELRAAFERAMTDGLIESLAMSKKFRVEESKKRKILLNYLMKIKLELYEGQISGSVEGK